MTQDIADVETDLRAAGGRPTTPAGSLTHFIAAALGGLLVGGLLLLATGLSPPATVFSSPTPDPFPEEAESLTQRLRSALWKQRLADASQLLDTIEARARRELLSDAPDPIARRRVETLLTSAEDEVAAYLAEQRQSARVDVKVDSADLSDVMDRIGRRVGATILVDPNVQETVTVELREIRWREAVDVIARMTRCEVEERPGGILVLVQPPKVTIQFTDANVRTVLQLLAAYSGKNIVITPDVTGTLTIDLKEINWLSALRTIARTHRCKVYRMDPDMVIVSKAELPNLRPVVAPTSPPTRSLTLRIKALRTRLAVGRVTLTLEAEASEVVDRIGAQAGQRLEIDPDLAGKRVRLRVHRAPWRTAFEAVASQVGGRVETTKARTRIALETGTRLTAYGAPAAVWFELLTLLGDRAVRVVPAARGRRVTVDLRDVDPIAAARASALSIGCELRAQPNAHQVRPLGEEPKPSSVPARRVTVVDPKAGKLKLTYQGSALYAGERLALLDGVIQRQGEALLRPDGSRCRLKLIEVTPDGVVLQQTGGKGLKFHLQGVPQ